MSNFHFDSPAYQEFKHETMFSMGGELDTHSFCHADTHEECLFNLIQRHMDTAEFWGHGMDVTEVHKVAMAFELTQNPHKF